MYGAVKDVHIACVIASLSLFVTRGSLDLAGVNWRRYRWLRIFPHVIDTILLVSGLTLAWLLGQYPFVDAWLTAKVLALIGYIILGALALRTGFGRWPRVAAMFAAVLIFAYIVSVALAHNPWGVLA